MARLSAVHVDARRNMLPQELLQLTVVTGDWRVRIELVRGAALGVALAVAGAEHAPGVPSVNLSENLVHLCVDLHELWQHFAQRGREIVLSFLLLSTLLV